MFDSYNRRINYLRISVTDRCNLRCTYCMPEEGVKLLNHKEILTFEEIYEIAKTAVDFGIDKIRLTGGEPLVRKGILLLVKQIASIKGLKDFGMTTNGIFLESYAKELKEAGLHRINISLDTLNAEKFKSITRGGDIEAVFKGIKAAKQVGLSPIKINCVVQNSSSEQDAKEVKAFCEENGLQIRFIKLMNLKEGTFSIVEHGEGGNCASCNRLRLTANGMIKPCLFSELEYNIRELGIDKTFELAVGNKPACGTTNRTNQFSNIGG
ncbi:MAG: GTP 3',8-cyclase MoaA [Bacteroidetes bacterium]|jgi:GTP 3',8-cyclase|nr:GTP 3',8-cyclase MoaA [Bacteroidota bacterium]MBT5530999.1 GTP 3',8-cyclase MoaA [Cytophagia bacterium]MBT3799874.1 GTP 3',8-cyclase MoaA [Bacteroidota bacterium]MBT3934491.1 GTP 3',8-cyclase MoaA [Bacteroidota bacterium]MBT4339103.1 GTP 3',8-cyclase MoaA [Bacteroidota bacterium]